MSKIRYGPAVQHTRVGLLECVATGTGIVHRIWAPGNEAGTWITVCYELLEGYIPSAPYPALTCLFCISGTS